MANVAQFALSDVRNRLASTATLIGALAIVAALSAGLVYYAVFSPEIAIALRATLVAAGSFAIVRAIIGRKPSPGSAAAPVAETEGAADAALTVLPVALLRLQQDGTILFANSAAQQLLGEANLVGSNLLNIAEGLASPLAGGLGDAISGKPRLRPEIARCSNGQADAFFQVSFLRVESGDRPLVFATLTDATELKALEAQFVQSQKMQAVGQLAGGVAHDFNNLLTAINGHCDLLLLRHSKGDFDHGDLVQIRQNGNRAAALVRQLLAFSRKQTLQPKIVNLTGTLADLAHLLNRLLSEKVELLIECVADLQSVRVDERQFEQVIMNLVVNARDAMPDGGQIKITCRNERFDASVERNRATMPAGDYVAITVEDTGSGMNLDQLGKIFEPFYTTKRVGEGTGLGLSTAYGIIKQTGGYIFAESEPEVGTTFSIFLPASDEVAPAPANRMETKAVASGDLTGQGQILLTEDEAAVRSFAARALRLRGYNVLEASSGEEALNLLSDKEIRIDMFISDVIMPGSDGPTWVRQALIDRPDAKVIFVSGYAEDAFKNGSANVPNSVFLPKPFSLTDLTRVVKEQMPFQPEAA